MRSAACLTTLFLAASPLLAQGSVVLPPVQPKNFSHVAGKFFLSMTAAPTQVNVEQPITVRVRLVASGPVALAPERKKLRIFPADLGDAFHIEDAADQDEQRPQQGVWEFVYRLRPKDESVTIIPGPELVYWAPAIRKFQTTLADPIDIVVKAAPPPTAKELKLKVVPAPPSFFTLAPLDEVLREQPPLPAPGLMIITVAASLPPVVCLARYWLWRRRNPTLAQRRQRSRSRAAQQTLRYLETDKPDAVRLAAALTGYLRQRVDFRAVEPTPAEISEHLRRLGAAKGVCAGWAALFDSLAGVRFAPVAGIASAPQPGERLSDQLSVKAAELIHALEAEPCVQR